MMKILRDIADIMRKWWLRLAEIKVVPVKAIDEIIVEYVKYCDKVLTHIEDRVKKGGKIIIGFDQIKSDLENLKAEIGWEKETLNRDIWEKKSEDDKKSYFKKIQEIYNLLRRLNRDDRIWGIVVVVITAALLLASAIEYRHLHRTDKTPRNTPSEQSVADDAVVEITKQLSIMESLAPHFLKNEDQAQVKFNVAFEKLRSLIMPLSRRLQPEVIQQVGVVAAEIEMNAVNTATITGLRKKIEAGVANLRTDYFWTTTPKKWLEIAFWALWGTFVGILFYAATLLSSGIFYVHKIPMMVVEIVITPFVVVIIFFLFSFTDITVLTPSESTIYTTLGLSFIFGFAIRRTVGLLDNIKRRVFPQPQTEEESK